MTRTSTVLNRSGDPSRTLLAAAAAVLLLCAAGCSKTGGEFAFKRGLDDNYRRIDGIPEFSSSEQVAWVFAAGRLKDGQIRLDGSMVLGVTMLKRETVWVDVNSRTERVDPEKNMIYGTIEGLEPGRYKIQIFADRTTIREKEFVIYDGESDDEPGEPEEP